MLWLILFIISVLVIRCLLKASESTTPTDVQSDAEPSLNISSSSRGSSKPVQKKDNSKFLNNTSQNKNSFLKYTFFIVTSSPIMTTAICPLCT